MLEIIFFDRSAYWDSQEKKWQCKDEMLQHILQADTERYALIKIDYKKPVPLEHEANYC